jgi:transposase
MPEEDLDAVIGVDTHRDTHTAALVDTVGRQLAVLVISADAAGYARLLAWAAEQAPGSRVLWAIEGTRSHGAGLCRALAAVDARITEVDRPTRRARRAGKSDPIDALLAARAALAVGFVRQPRIDADQEAARLLLVERDRLVRHRTAVLNQMRDVVLTAPEELRHRLRDRSIAGLIAACSALRPRGSDGIEMRVRLQSLRRLARRARALTEDAMTVETDLKDLTTTNVPQLLAEPGIGPIVAAQLWVSWSHPGRIRSEAAFAALAGTSPLPASSGQVTRFRLNRGGDRHLNRALHQVMITRLSCHSPIREYVLRRTSNGKTQREAQRCIKRYLARRIWRLLDHGPAVAATT